MTSFFGPENPQPFSVISERYRRELQIAKDELKSKGANSETLAQLFNLGPEYNRNFCDAIREYGELNVDMRVAYVGPTKGSLANDVADQLDLVYPIEHIVAGSTLFEDMAVSDRELPVRQISVGADDFFHRTARECLASGTAIYDRVIVRDAVEFLQDRNAFFANVMSCLEKPGGKMILFHRSSQLLTLPFYSEAKRKIAETDIGFISLIDELSKLKMDVEWEVVTLPAVISRTKWLSLIYYQFPAQLEITSPADIYSGLRELTEGSLKYADDNIEFVDRMILIVVTNPEVVPNPVSRLGGSDISYIPTPQLYRMTVNSRDMEERYQRLLAQRPAYTGPAEWWGTVSKEKWIQVDSSKIPKARLNNMITDEACVKTRSQNKPK